MIDTLRTTAEEAMKLLERREVSPRELFDAYRAAIVSARCLVADSGDCPGASLNTSCVWPFTSSLYSTRVRYSLGLALRSSGLPIATS